MSDNDFKFYDNDEITFFSKYLYIQHLLVSNQGNSQLEAFIFLSCPTITAPTCARKQFEREEHVFAISKK
jgi:hypothetical protein